MRKAATTSVAFTAVAVLSFGFGSVAAHADTTSQEGGLSVIGLAGDHTLVGFDTDQPGLAQTLGDVSGLAPADQELVGIDYRVQDGKLYGVGRGGGVYSIDPDTQLATPFAQLSIPLDGQSFGVDFNPAANALRVVSDTGQNLRQPFATTTATVADAVLTTPPTAGTTAGVSGAAYTNNDLDPTSATTLYDLATATDDVVLQSPANAGTLAPTGKAGLDLTGDTGFDIYSQLVDGKAVALFPFAVNGGRLYSVELFNGRFEDAGLIGNGSVVVTDLAIPLDQIRVATSTVTGTLAAGTVRYGSSAVLTVQVAAAGSTPTGEVTVKSGSAVLGSGTLTGGTVQFTLRNTLSVKVHQLVISYAGSMTVSPSTATVALTVLKATSKTAATSPPATVAKNSAKVVRVTVVADPAVQVNGAVSVSITQNGVQKASATAQVRAGAGAFTLPALKVAGSYRVKLTYTGSATVDVSKSEFVVVAK